MAYKDGSRQRGGKTYSQHGSLKKFIRERDNYTCQLCGKEGWIVDHIIPYAVSHDSTISNLRVLCYACNVLTSRQRGVPKRFHTLAEWYLWLEQELALTANQ